MRFQQGQPCMAKMRFHIKYEPFVLQTVHPCSLSLYLSVCLSLSLSTYICVFLSGLSIRHCPSVRCRSVCMSVWLTECLCVVAIINKRPAAAAEINNVSRSALQYINALFRVRS